jgi:hypothetical protein
MLRFISRSIGALCALLLAACTGAPLMGLEVSDYRETFGWTGDEQLLTAILRAKDGAPLHFTELSTLGASNQLSTGLQASGPIAGLDGSSRAISLQGTAGAQTTPSFTLSSLEVQQFTQGMLNPIGPQVIQQFLEEGIDKRLILILFFSGIINNKVSWYNNVKCDLDAKLNNPNALCQDDLYNFLHHVDEIARAGKKMVARSYVALTPMGVSVPWSGTGVKDIAGIDPMKYVITPDPRNPANGLVYSTSEPRLALCYVHEGRPAIPVVPTRLPVCTYDKVFVPPYQTDTQSQNGLIVRSTYEVIEYLGQILSFQEEKRAEGKDQCITLSGRPQPYRTCEDDVLFQVNPMRGTKLVSTVYNGMRYTINSDGCYDPLVCDHSAEVLKIVNMLINYNKSAASIPQIPTVRTIQ